MRGKFITIEGCDGAGKTSVADHVEHYLQTAGIDVVRTREPGGTPISQRVREILVDTASQEMEPETELLLMFAARAQLVAEVIRPALERG